MSVNAREFDLNRSCTIGNIFKIGTNVSDMANLSKTCPAFSLYKIPMPTHFNYVCIVKISSNNYDVYKYSYPIPKLIKESLFKRIKKWLYMI